MVGQCLNRAIGLEGEPLVFTAAPEEFNAVEFGAVGRQKEEGKSLSFPVGDAGLKGGGAMGRCIVEHDDGGLREVLAKVIEKGDDLGRAHAVRGRVGVQLCSIMAQKAGYV